MDKIEIPVFYNYKEAEKNGFSFIDEGRIKGNGRDGFYQIIVLRCMKPFYFKPRNCFFNEGEIMDKFVRIN